MNARPGASSEPAMHKDDNYETSIGPVVAKLRVNHDAAEITARLQDRHGESVVRATVERSTRPALGVSLRLASETDTDMVRAGVYLGRMRLTVGARGNGLRALLSGAGIKRRLLSAEVYRWDDEGVVSGATIVQAHLWSPDDGSDQRHVWLNVTDKLWGRRQHTDKVLEEREVQVWLPEATYPCTARLVERTVTRPRSPFQRFTRFVEFYDCAAVVPRRKSDSFAHIDDGRVCVEAQSIEQGLGVLTGRILQDRRQYGGQRWANGIPAREKWQDSHKVTVISLDGKALAERDLMHGEVIEFCGVQMRRDEQCGGLVATTTLTSRTVKRGERTMALSGSERLFNCDTVSCKRTNAHLIKDPFYSGFTVHFSPIGTPPVSVAVGSLTSENKGPAIARNGRMHLSALTKYDLDAAREIDPEWVAANHDIVRRVEAGERYTDGRWCAPPDLTQFNGPLPKVGRSIAEEFGYVEQDVAAAVQDLAAHPPEVSPSEEAEGAAAREYAENGPTEKLVAVESGEELAKQMADYRLIDLVK